MGSLSKKMRRAFRRPTASERGAVQEALNQEAEVRRELNLPPASREPKKLYGDLATRKWVKELRDGIGASSAGGQNNLFNDPYDFGPSVPPPPSPGRLQIIRSDGSVMHEQVVSGVDTDWWEVASTVYPPEDGIIKVPESFAKWKEGTVAFNACTFDATSDYMLHTMGRKLDSYDKDYAKYHPLSMDSGVPQEYTGTVIQGMVEPYGLRISRMRIRAGSLASGAEPMKWVRALGCNPYGMVDHTTNNEQAIERMKAEGFPPESIPTLEEANRRWRLEFHEEPLRPSIVGVSGYQASGVSTGAGMGHALYLSPRAPVGNWRISVQLDQAANVRYAAEPEMPTYHRRTGALTLVLGDIKRPDGRPVATLVKGRYTAPTPTLPATPNLLSAGRESYSQGTADDLLNCVSCKTLTKLEDFEEGMLLCSHCYQIIWEEYRCPKCQMRFNKFVPDFEAPLTDDPSEPAFSCPNPNCEASLELPKDDPELKTVQAAVVAYNELIDARWGFDEPSPAV